MGRDHHSFQVDSSSHTAVNSLVTGHSAQRQVVLQDKFLEVDLVSQWVFAFAVWRDSGQLLSGASSFFFLPPAKYECALSP